MSAFFALRKDNNFKHNNQFALSTFSYIHGLILAQGNKVYCKKWIN